jgi:hypothetical protein
MTGNVVLDQLTGLMWTKNANLPGLYKTWLEALEYIAAMNSGFYNNFGYNDWRLPNINELESLANAGEPDIGAWLISKGFINVQSLRYWSSTTYPSYLDFAWVLNLIPGWGACGIFWKK